MTMTTPSIAQQLARFAAGLSLADVPEGVIETAKGLILDSLGVGLASNAYPFADPSVQASLDLGGNGDCTVIGRTERLPVRDAALVNGILIHGLDFDDTHLESIVHVTAACLPCALTYAESRARSGADMLTAYIAGAEAAIRIGLGIRGGFHHVGFHATGVIAHFSSAIIAGKLLDLSAAQLTAAQGIVGSTASGIQVFLEEGAWTKRFHPGWAAVAGITAAHLAKAGFHGPSRPYEGKFGLVETHLQEHAKDADMNAMARDLGTRWHVADIAVKPYPVCHFIHGCADAAISIHEEINPDDIVSVEAHLAQPTLHIVAEPAHAKERPNTEYEVKFSAQFVIATCLLKGRFGLAELQQAAIEDPATRALALRVRCQEDPRTAFPKFFSGGVTVTLRDGRTISRYVEINRGAGARAMNISEITEKFMASACLVVPESQALAIRDAVLNLENLAPGELARHLAARVG